MIIGRHEVGPPNGEKKGVTKTKHCENKLNDTLNQFIQMSITNIEQVEAFTINF